MTERMAGTGYLVAAALGAVGGGLAVALTTKAAPGLMAKMQEHCREMCQGMTEAKAEPAEGAGTCCEEKEPAGCQ